MELAVLSIALAAVVLSGIPLCAQTELRPGKLSAREENGKKIFQQRCSVCHTSPISGDRTFGPQLSSESASGKETAVREIVMKGTARMPGFQYGLRTEEIDNIVSYLETVKSEQAGKQSNSRGVAEHQTD